MSGRAATAVAAVAIALAGCGGSDAETGGADDWRAQADAICEEAERTIRGRDPATDNRDLERVMVSVRDDLRAAASKLRALEIPDADRKRAEPFLRSVDRVERTAERVRAQARDPEKLELIADKARLLDLDLQEHAEAAGLRRCGRPEAGTAAVDAFLMPGYASAAAVAVAHVLGTMEEAGSPTGSAARRARYWATMSTLVDRSGVGFVAPEGVDGAETDFQHPLQELQYLAQRIAGYYDGSLKKKYRSAAGARDQERRARAYIADARRSAFALLEATGPAGEKYVRVIRRELKELE